ncbi:MAG: MmcQ/YjbR family DNA-binding protein [Chloroflexi bacterium]|nr:MmcQ/YjbR family DNA-binding protein [Chloroflexota bacterium]
MPLIQSKEGLRLLGRIRQLCTRYPEFYEHIDDFGHTSFRVRDKPFLIMSEWSGSFLLNMKLLYETQDFLVQTGRFEKSAYIGQHGWTLLRLDNTADWEEVEDLIDDAYRRVAPKSVRKILD